MTWLCVTLYNFGLTVEGSICLVCGGPFVVDEFGVAHHIDVGERYDEIGQELDAGHVPHEPEDER
jgi:hypothetical protein